MNNTSAQVDISNILQTLRYHSTGKIFRHPCSLPDGTIYEASDLYEWIEQNGQISPTTKLPITGKVFEATQLKHFIDELCERFPELEKQRLPNYDPPLLKILDIHSLIEASSFDKLLKIKNITVSDLNNYDFGIMARFVKSPTNVFEHVMSQIKTVDDIKTNRGWSILNCACRESDDYNALKNAKYLINQGANPNHQCTGDGWSAFYQLTYFCGNIDTMELFLQKGADLFLKNENGDCAFRVSINRKNKDYITRIMKYVDRNKNTLNELLEYTEEESVRYLIKSLY